MLIVIHKIINKDETNLSVEGIYELSVNYIIVCDGFIYVNYTFIPLSIEAGIAQSN